MENIILIHGSGHKAASWRETVSHLIHKEDVLAYVNENDFEVLVVLGAGDLDNYVPEIEKILLNKTGR